MKITIRKIRKALRASKYWIFTKLFGWKYFDSKYLKGKYFIKPWSVGWEWAYRSF